MGRGPEQPNPPACRPTLPPSPAPGPQPHEEFSPSARVSMRLCCNREHLMLVLGGNRELEAGLGGDESPLSRPGWLGHWGHERASRKVALRHLPSNPQPEARQRHRSMNKCVRSQGVQIIIIGRSSGRGRRAVVQCAQCAALLCALKVESACCT